jgi:small conductance mechanosensitive channel
MAVVFFSTTLIINCIIFIVIMAVAMILGRVFGAMVAAAFNRAKRTPSQLLQIFFITWTSRLFVIIGLVVALQTIGVQMGPVIASLGVAGFIVGFAIQGTLSNFASGLMLLIYQPFDVGDVVEINGVTGKVRELTIVNTTLTTPDNKFVIIPNSNVWGNTIINFTKNPTRRIDLVLSVSYDADLDQVQQLVREFVSADAEVMSDPELVVEVLSMGESSIDFAVRPWVKTGEYWNVYWRLQKGLKQLMDKNDIEIPFPQRVVHMQQDKT